MSITDLLSLGKKSKGTTRTPSEVRAEEQHNISELFGEISCSYDAKTSLDLLAVFLAEKQQSENADLYSVEDARAAFLQSFTRSVVSYSESRGLSDEMVSRYIDEELAPIDNNTLSKLALDSSILREKFAYFALEDQEKAESKQLAIVAEHAAQSARAGGVTPIQDLDNLYNSFVGHTIVAGSFDEHIAPHNVRYASKLTGSFIDALERVANSPVDESFYGSFLFLDERIQDIFTHSAIDEPQYSQLQACRARCGLYAVSKLTETLTVEIMQGAYDPESNVLLTAVAQMGLQCDALRKNYAAHLPAEEEQRSDAAQRSVIGLFEAMKSRQAALQETLPKTQRAIYNSIQAIIAGVSSNNATESDASFREKMTTYLAFSQKNSNLLDETEDSIKEDVLALHDQYVAARGASPIDSKM